MLNKQRYSRVFNHSLVTASISTNRFIPTVSVLSQRFYGMKNGFLALASF